MSLIIVLITTEYELYLSFMKCIIYIFYSPHYSGRENKRTTNTTTQKNKQYKRTPTDQTLDIIHLLHFNCSTDNIIGL